MREIVNLNNRRRAFRKGVEIPPDEISGDWDKDGCPSIQR